MDDRKKKMVKWICNVNDVEDARLQKTTTQQI